MNGTLKSVMWKTHVNCRNSFYPQTNGTIIRFPVQDNQVRWDVPWPEYNPTNYTSTSIKGKSWSDPDIGDSTFNPSWNSIDGLLNRKSYCGVYEVANSFPLNIIGRTGLRGRGLLGRWGPNHAVDAIVTTWKRDSKSNLILHDESRKPILRFISVQRSDTKQWALPGGMIDQGETSDSALKREFIEEALGGTKEYQNLELEVVDNIFKIGVNIYSGYVDDHRNTDNAWIETFAVNFHDDEGTVSRALVLRAGDDAMNVSWLDIDRFVDLYADHLHFLELVAEKYCAHW